MCCPGQVQNLAGQVHFPCWLPSLARANISCNIHFSSINRPLVIIKEIKGDTLPKRWHPPTISEDNYTIIAVSNKHHLAEWAINQWQTKSLLDIIPSAHFCIGGHNPSHVFCNVAIIPPVHFYRVDRIPSANFPTRTKSLLWTKSLLLNFQGG